MANPHIVDAWLTNQQLQRLEDYLKRGRPFASVSRTYENSPAQSYRCTGRSRIIVGTAILNRISLLDDFDEYYKTLFRTGYDPTSILALQTWLNAIDEAWPNLALNEVLKAGRLCEIPYPFFSFCNLCRDQQGADTSSRAERYPGGRAEPR